jgi:hypothetical protein
MKWLSRCCKFTLQVDEFWEKHLAISQISPRKERMVGIIRGEFVNSRESLDLMENQGRYVSIPNKIKAQEGQIH